MPVALVGPPEGLRGSRADGPLLVRRARTALKALKLSRAELSLDDPSKPRAQPSLEDLKRLLKPAQGDPLAHDVVVLIGAGHVGGQLGHQRQPPGVHVAARVDGPPGPPHPVARAGLRPVGEGIQGVDSHVTRNAISRARIMIIGRDRKDDDDDDGPPSEGESSDLWLKEVLSGLFPTRPLANT